MDELNGLSAGCHGRSRFLERLEASWRAHDPVLARFVELEQSIMRMTDETKGIYVRVVHRGPWS